jgi:hypothetical protein
VRRGRLALAVITRRKKARQGAARIESKGRPVGAVAGSWVTDLAELKQSILLCGVCDYKWRRGAKKYGYELAKRWTKIWGGVTGKCDDCRQSGPQRSFYYHEALSGKVYDPNDR